MRWLILDIVEDNRNVIVSVRVATNEKEEKTINRSGRATLLFYNQKTGSVLFAMSHAFATYIPERVGASQSTMAGSSIQ